MIHHLRHRLPALDRDNVGGLEPHLPFMRLNAPAPIIPSWLHSFSSFRGGCAATACGRLLGTLDVQPCLSAAGYAMLIELYHASITGVSGKVFGHHVRWAIGTQHLAQL